MEQHQFKSLLTQVAALSAHYKKIDSLTGENFNIFRILKLEASEVRLHSAFIATLLDPNGTHGQKETFLKLFINQFCFKQNAIDSTSCKVEVEKHAGFISSDLTEGGRIDIIISDKSGNHIIIENKIYAGDQVDQLKRYYNHSPNADLIYLTLDGILPSEISFGELVNDTHFKCFSYKIDIIRWLEDCRKEVTVFPVVRESLTQYINLIKYLTNQTLNHTMQTELDQLLLSDLEASFIIADGLDSALDHLLINDFIPKLKKLCTDLGTTLDVGINFNKNYSGLRVKKPEWLFLNINFEFQGIDKNMIYGFSAIYDPTKSPVSDDLRSNLKALGTNGSKNSTWWPLYYNVDAPYNNWNKFETWKAIQDGSMLLYMREKIVYLLELSKGLTL